MIGVAASLQEDMSKDASCWNLIELIDDLRRNWFGCCRLVWPVAFSLYGVGSAGQRHIQAGFYGSGSSRACVDRRVLVNFQIRLVGIGGGLLLETRKPIIPVAGSSQMQCFCNVCLCFECQMCYSTTNQICYTPGSNNHMSSSTKRIGIFSDRETGPAMNFCRNKGYFLPH
ncbi:uncharacterized protein LOC121050740 [Rosa chinensis]|uniref:uncharacterized protein LOC121050740 n=1 Tax=Rosa chinensis TaxID=74649 RepID=UPI001AD8E3A7|nr:uncharacterized protein LOC121050740 [Rosa chinensis]